jgi:cytoskeletal protein CcmA (bactofilin family)
MDTDDQRREINMKRVYLIFFLLMMTLAAPGCATVSTSGDYTLQQGKTLRGNLVVTSGNATLEQASRVTGDVIMTSGNLQANGEVDGNILLTSGNVSLGPQAVVKGNITATSGNVSQAEGAQVRGEISSNQSAVTIGGAFFARLFGLLCCAPLLLIGGLIFLLAVLLRRKPTAVSADQGPVEATSEKLKNLKQMFDEGLITEAEYEAKKAEILADM